jgi:nucleotide-binding universal stress UspA family protein
MGMPTSRPSASWSVLERMMTRKPPGVSARSFTVDLPTDGENIIAAFISAENSIASADVALTVAAVPFDYDVIRSGAAQQATQLEAEVRRQTNGYDVAIEFVHSHRDAANELLSLAKGVRADLIVVGKSTSFFHAFVGSVAKRLTACRSAPVIVVVP